MPAAQEWDGSRQDARWAGGGWPARHGEEVAWKPGRRPPPSKLRREAEHNASKDKMRLELALKDERLAAAEARASTAEERVATLEAEKVALMGELAAKATRVAVLETEIRAEKQWTQGYQADARSLREELARSKAASSPAPKRARKGQ